MTDSALAPVLETARLVLRAHRLEDFAESAAMWADMDVVRHITGAPSSAEASWSRLLRYAGHWSLLGFGYWVVAAKRDGRFIGEVGFADYRRDIEPSLDGRPEAGWVLKASEHGRGFATEALTRAVAWADRALTADATVCIFDPEHAASIKVAQKTGYAYLADAVYRGEPTLVMARRRQEGQA